MASDPKTDATDRQRLPFEPSGKAASRKKDKGKQAAQEESQPVVANADPATASLNRLKSQAKQILAKTKAPEKGAKSGASRQSAANDAGIPEVISRRMVSRMMVLCGLPSAMGILVFLISFQLVSNDWVKLPNVAVLLVSMGCFGLGVVGLSYGALSASWDEEHPGSWLGIAEFSTNLKRMTGAWAETREKRKAKQP